MPDALDHQKAQSREPRDVHVKTAYAGLLCRPMLALPSELVSLHGL
jgi:hypothetical protein